MLSLTALCEWHQHLVAVYFLLPSAILLLPLVYMRNFTAWQM